MCFTVCRKNWSAINDVQLWCVFKALSPGVRSECATAQSVTGHIQSSRSQQLWVYVRSSTASSDHSCPSVMVNDQRTQRLRGAEKQLRSERIKRGKDKHGTRTRTSSSYKPPETSSTAGSSGSEPWLLIIPWAWSKLNLWHWAGAARGIIN